MSARKGPVSPVGVSRRRRRGKNWLWIPVIVVAAAVAAAAVMLSRRADQTPDSAALSTPSKPAPIGVGCPGRIEPEDGVILVAAPYFDGRPALVKELRVKEGDSVRTAQVLAILDARDSLEKALRQQQADIEVARMKLAQVKAGAKQADIEALKMDIARWESELETAASEQKRYKELRENDIVSDNDFDQKQLATARAQRMLGAARERLKSLEEVRKEDVDVLSAQLASAMAQAEHASAELERAVVRAPVDGKVLKIHAHAGEEVGAQGVLELARTDRMYVVAEVYETDVARVRVGQRAEISGELLPGKLAGTVFQIGSQVTRSELLPLDPAAFADTRVVKVKIRLDNGAPVAGLIYGKVDVVILP